MSKAMVYYKGGFPKTGNVSKKVSKRFLMPKKTISIIQLEQLVREGNGVSEIARKLGVTKGAVSKKLKALKKRVHDVYAKYKSSAQDD